MAWEVWFDDSGRSYGNMGFFCNTVDVCFGPVFYVDNCFDKGQFYEMWEKAGFKDPRTDDANYTQHAYRILSLMGYDENITATMKVFNHGKLLYEESRKECYENLSFSPFHDELESQSEEDFDMICSLMEDCESDMKHLLLTEPDEKTAFMETQYKDFDIRVEMVWEVLDES